MIIRCMKIMNFFDLFSNFTLSVIALLVVSQAYDDETVVDGGFESIARILVAACLR